MGNDRLDEIEKKAELGVSAYRAICLTWLLFILWFVIKYIAPWIAELRAV